MQIFECTFPLFYKVLFLFEGGKCKFINTNQLILPGLIFPLLRDFVWHLSSIFKMELKSFCIIPVKLALQSVLRNQYLTLMLHFYIKVMDLMELKLVCVVSAKNIYINIFKCALLLINDE